ncbi:MAG: hypothetical protein HEP71_16745 [Roseivirga sp.]|nr:hypothetical protein [Roseivirga sp.]
MKKISLYVISCLWLLSLVSTDVTGFKEEHVFTPLLTVTFETNEEGMDYRSNTFDDTASDVWARTNLPDGPNNNTTTYSNIQGSYYFSGEDIDAPENPLGGGEDGYLMLKTLDVSAYQGGTVQVKAHLGGNTATGHRYNTSDYLKMRYAFDADIATGANSSGGLPSVANLNTGTYTTFGAFYGTGGPGASAQFSSALINDADLDGDPDFTGRTGVPATDVVTADSLKNALAEWTFTFDVGATDTNVSILIQVATDAGSNEIAIDQIVVSAEAGVAAPTSVNVTATVFLEGAYNGTDLNTTLNSSIPSTQPYTNNGHAGAETAGAVPANAVDWVLVELREAGSAVAALNSTKVGSAAGFLMNDGTIKGTDGTSDLTVPLSGNTGSDFFVVVYHRNHLPIMSANTISESGSTYTIDFTIASANTHQGTTGLASLAGAKFGMLAGDADGDGDVDSADLTTWRAENGKAFSYGTNGKNDLNLDGAINAVDRIEFQKKNVSKTSQVPTN